MALQVAQCDHGVETELEPEQGAGTVVQRVHDAHGLGVGLVVRPVLGTTLRIYTSAAAGRTLLATISVGQL